ncbi:hypothetical protein TNCV_1850761 [Trichonephila clavipes]|nr:hypothetical protein TNCV_1850761 [Trichonephila clavipes]
MTQWPSGSVSSFHTTVLKFYPWAGQGQLSLSSILQWVDKRVPSLLRDLNKGVSLQTVNLIGTCANAPQHLMVSHTEMGTVGLSPHGLLRHSV